MLSRPSAGRDRLPVEALFVCGEITAIRPARFDRDFRRWWRLFDRFVVCGEIAGGQVVGVDALRHARVGRARTLVERHFECRGGGHLLLRY
jgi:hypothetical protein